MKTTRAFVALIIICLLGAASALAGRPAVKGIDTLTVTSTGAIDKYVARWQFSVSTTPDTIVLPARATAIDFLHKGAAAGTDTLFASVSPAGRAAAFSVQVNIANVVYTYDARGPYITRLIVKGGTTFNVILIVRN